MNKMDEIIEYAYGLSIVPSFHFPDVINLFSGSVLVLSQRVCMHHWECHQRMYLGLHYMGVVFMLTLTFVIRMCKA